MARVLVVDDEPDIRSLVVDFLAAEGHDTLEADNGETALDLIRQHAAAVVILDVNLPKMTGLEVLRRTADVPARPPIMMLTAMDDVRTAVEAMQLGAFDYLTKPLDSAMLRLRVRRAVERHSLLEEIGTLKTRLLQSGPLALIGPSGAMQDVLRRIEQVAATRFTVLIQGETGTGKELVARAIHAQSDRREGPFVAIDCGAIPDTLIESELFGYERGAFTGADRRKEGHFELADGGTLFLDEVGNLPGATQMALLRVLQERTIWRVGAKAPTPVDVRIIAATNTSLSEAVTRGTFRDDLFYRLNEFPLLVPPLRERRDDIMALALRFLEEASVELKRPVRGFADDAVAALGRHPWPGNVRELRNVVRRAVLVTEGTVTAADLALPDAASPTPVVTPASPVGGAFASLKAARDEGAAEAERRAIRGALIAAGGNKSEAARLLKTDFKTLHVKMKALGITLGGRQPS